VVALVVAAKRHKNHKIKSAFAFSALLGSYGFYGNAPGVIRQLPFPFQSFFATVR